MGAADREALFGGMPRRQAAILRSRRAGAVAHGCGISLWRQLYRRSEAAVPSADEVDLDRYADTVLRNWVKTNLAQGPGLLLETTDGRTKTMDSLGTDEDGSEVTSLSIETSVLEQVIDLMTVDPDNAYTQE